MLVDEFRTATFTLVVQEPISAEEYKENLIGKTYEYNLSMGVVSLTFTSDSIMTMTMPTTSDDREDGDNPNEAGVTTVNIRYQITDGRVTVLTDHILNQFMVVILKLVMIIEVLT